MRFNRAIGFFSLLCILLAPAILPKQDTVLFQKEPTFAGIEKDLSANESSDQDDFRLPVFHMLRHRFAGKPLNDNSIHGIASAEMINHQWTVSNTVCSPSFLYERSALNYLFHIYPSHNFW